MQVKENSSLKIPIEVLYRKQLEFQNDKYLKALDELIIQAYQLSVPVYIISKNTIAIKHNESTELLIKKVEDIRKNYIQSHYPEFELI